MSKNVTIYEVLTHFEFDGSSSSLKKLGLS